MGNPRLNELFARYRASGNPGDLGRVFDECAPGLLRIARRLARDAAGAEDLLQETFLAVIEHAGAWDSSRPVGPWLIGILTNRARTARRRAGRDVEPDRLEVREPGLPDADLQGAELESAVRAALQGLPQAERAAVGARLFEGLSGPEIAERFGISSGLGRVRLHRGLQRLRAALPSGLSLGVGGLALPGSTLARVKSVVLAEAAKGAGASAAVSGAAAGPLGVIQIASAMAAVIIILVGTRGLWSGGDALDPIPETQLAAVEGGLAAPVAEITKRRADETQGRAPVGAVTGAADQTAPATVSITARIVDGATGEPLVGAALEAMSFVGIKRQSKSLTVAEDGRVRVSVPVEFERAVLRVSPTDTTGEMSRTILPAELGDELLIEVLGGGTFEGRVVDGDGNPVPGAELSGWCGAYVRDKNAPHRTARADSLGRFRIEGLGPDFHLLGTADGFASRQGFRGRLAAGETVSGLELVLDRAAYVEGRVVDLEGRPIAGVEISTKPGFGSSSSADQTDYQSIQKLFGRWVQAESDASGRFRAGPVPAGGAMLSFAAPGFLRQRETYRPVDNPHLVSLDPGLSLIGEVTLPDGSPAVGASVRVGPRAQDPAAVRGRWTTDANGGFRANGISPPTDSPYEAPPFVFVSMPGYAIALLQPVEPSRRPEEHVARLQLVPELTIGGRVTWPDGAPAVNVRLKVEGERVYAAEAVWDHPPTWEWKMGVDEVRTAADGRFLFKQLGSGRYKIHAFDPADPKRRVTALVAAGEDAAHIVMDPEVLLGRTLRGFVKNAATGDPIVDFNVLPYVNGRGQGRDVHDDSGRFFLTGLEDGPIGLTVQADGFATSSLEDRDYPSDHGPVEVALWPAATLRFRVVDGNGELRTEQCVVRVSEGASSELMLAQGGAATANSYRTSEPGRGRIFGLPATQVLVQVACGKDSEEFPLDLSVIGEEEIEFIVAPAPERPMGGLNLLVAYLPGLDPAEASESFARFQRAVINGEEPRPEPPFTMEEIDPVLASFEMTLTHESGDQQMRLTAKLLPGGLLELQEFDKDLRRHASGTSYAGRTEPRTSPVPDFSVGGWSGIWNVTAVSDAFRPFSGQIEIPVHAAGSVASDGVPIYTPTFIKVERR